MSDSSVQAMNLCLSWWASFCWPIQQMYCLCQMCNYNLKAGFRVAYKTSLVLYLFITKAITVINSVVSDYVTDTLLEKLQEESVINNVLVWTIPRKEQFKAYEQKDKKAFSSSVLFLEEGAFLQDRLQSKARKGK